jgi:hypothetical protein
MNTPLYLTQGIVFENGEYRRSNGDKIVFNNFENEEQENARNSRNEKGGFRINEKGEAVFE